MVQVIKGRNLERIIKSAKGHEIAERLWFNAYLIIILMALPWLMESFFTKRFTFQKDPTSFWSFHTSFKDFQRKISKGK
jgi:hypothetical protein